LLFPQYSTFSSSAGLEDYLKNLYKKGRLIMNVDLLTEIMRGRGQGKARYQGNFSSLERINSRLLEF